MRSEAFKSPAGPDRTGNRLLRDIALPGPPNVKGPILTTMNTGRSIETSTCIHREVAAFSGDL